MQPNAPFSEPVADMLFNRKQITVYILLVVLAFSLFVGGALIYRRGIDAYQREHSITPIQRVQAAVQAGDTAMISEQLPALLKETPLYLDQSGKPHSRAWEGPLLRDQVTPLEALTVQLMQHGMAPEAQQVAWKALLEYHIASRTLELLAPWELMYQLKGLQGDWCASVEVAKILAAHGARKLRRPNEMDPLGFQVDDTRLAAMDAAISPELVRGMQLFYEATQSAEFRNAAVTLQAGINRTTNASVQRQVRPLLQRAQIAAGMREEAHRLYTTAARGAGMEPWAIGLFWGSGPQLNARVNLLRRDPYTLDLMWQDRPATSQATLRTYIATYAADPRIRTLDFSQLAKTNLGYFNPNNNFAYTGDGLLMSQSVAGRMEIQTDQPVHKLYLSYQAQGALGVFPILLIRFRDEDPFTPIYCDSTDLALTSIEVNLPPGQYACTLVYLNDSGFTWRQSDVHEDRQLILHRLMLVQVPPAQ